MKRFLILFTLFVALHGGCVQAQDFQTLLRKMPDTVLPLLTHNNMLDFIDFKANNMRAEVTNKMKGKSEMTELTDSTCHIKLTEHSTVVIKLVQGDDEPCIIVSTTYKTDSVTSQSETYFSLDWKAQKKEVK
ncbi:MAG: DUF3256 family protein [Bacteroidaceae bacterium]|nr:DUF3256 family protein [Bacteroidaceae bacterium]